MPDSPDLSQRLLAQLRFPCGDVPEPGAIKNVELRAAHLVRNGVPADRIALFHRHKGGYAKGVVPLPTAFQRMIHAHPITLGGHRWDVIVGRGHAPEHASLWCPELNVLIAGDQVLPKISTNVGVWPNE